MKKSLITLGPDTMFRRLKLYCSYPNLCTLLILFIEEMTKTLIKRGIKISNAACRLDAIEEIICY